MKSGRLMNIRKCMPDCTGCKKWPWCSNIPNDCRKEQEMKNWKVKIILDGEVVDKFVFDFDEKMSEEDVKEVVFQYAVEALEIEVKEA